MKTVKVNHVKQSLDQVEQQLEELLYLVGDAPQPATEDQIMNYVIGMIESVKIKKQQLCCPWESFEPLKKS